MKANELMIGDWVFLKNGKVLQTCQVTVIGNATQNRNDIGKYVCLDMSDEFPTCIFEIDEISPIPITPEILEKNGFYYDEDRKAYLMGVIFLVKPERYGLFSFEICGCPYPLNTVHELQHALRLCGIEKEIVL